MARPPPRRKKAPQDPAAPAPKRTRKPRPTKGEKAAQRQERRSRRRAHKAGLRAVRREQWNRAREWLWPSHTRDLGRAKATLVLILNTAPFPGLGTALYGRPGRGLLQFALTFLFLIGWFWSLADGIRIARRAYGGPPPHAR